MQSLEQFGQRCFHHGLPSRRTTFKLLSPPIGLQGQFGFSLRPQFQPRSQEEGFLGSCMGDVRLFLDSE